MKTISFIISILLIIFINGCSNNRNEIVVYTSVDQVFSEPVLKDFEKQTGIKVKALYDTEETKSTGVLNRIIAEKNNPQCDLFWSGDPVRAIVLKNKNIAFPYISKTAEDINPFYKDPENYWTGFSARARVLIYNKNLLKKEDIPQSVFDLANKQLKGKIAIANPLFGTTTFHIAALFALLGDEKAKQFLTDLKQNKVVIATSNGDVKKRVMQGEVFCGLTDTDDAFEAAKEDTNIGFVFLDQNGIGSLIMPNTVNLIKNSPHQEKAKKLFDFLLSKKTETKLAKLCAQMPLHKGVQVPKGVLSLDNILPMKINYDETAKELEKIQPFLKEWIKK